MTTFEWEPVEFDDRPIYGPPCPGTDTHPWRLSIHEGRASVTSGCADCDEAVMGPVGGEDLEMDVEITGHLVSHLETYRTWETVEYDHWWIFVPESIGEPDA